MIQTWWNSSNFQMQVGFLFLTYSQLKARANARNIVGQQDATLLGPTCCERLHTMLGVVACCCDLLEVVGWSLKLVKLQSQQVPTFLLFRGHRSVVQQCCVRLHSTSNNVAPVHAHYKQRIQHGVGDLIFDFWVVLRTQDSQPWFRTWREWAEWYVWNCGYLCPRVRCILI